VQIYNNLCAHKLLYKVKLYMYLQLKQYGREVA